MEMRDFMAILKPVRTCNFMVMCALYLKEAQEYERDGKDHYEIGSANTKSGNPHTIFFN